MDGKLPDSTVLAAARKAISEPERFQPTEQIGVGRIILNQKEIGYLQEVIASNRLSYGPFHRRLERAFASEHDCRFAVYCNSGTSALEVAIQALKIKNGWNDGDEFIVPAVTFVASANVLLHNNLRPVFADVDPRTYNIDPHEVRKHITPKTRGMMPVHLFGQPCDMTPLLELAEEYGLAVVEDSCETMFAKYKGRKVGSFGQIGCFSTYVAHLIVGGVGGFATTNDPELAVLLRSLVNHGRDSIYLTIDDDKGLEEERLREVISRRFRFIHPGHSFRATEFEAALALAQLEDHPENLRRRQQIAACYTQRLKEFDAVIHLPEAGPDRDHVFMVYPLVLKNRLKSEMMLFLEENLIETRELMPLINQPIYVSLFGPLDDSYPVAKWINDCGFYIPCHQYLLDEEVEYIVHTLVTFLSHCDTNLLLERHPAWRSTWFS